MDSDTSAYLGALADKYQPGDDEFRQHILATAAVENAPGDPNAVSPKGALGRMQITPPTARGMGVNPDTATPEQLDDAAVRFKSHLWTKYGRDPMLTAAAYHAGEPAVDRAHGIPDTTDGLSTTADYAAKVTALSGQQPKTAPRSDDAIFAQTEAQLAARHGAPGAAPAAAPADPDEAIFSSAEADYLHANPPAPPPEQGAFSAGLSGFGKQMKEMGLGALAFTAEGIDKVVGGSPALASVRDWAYEHFQQTEKEQAALGRPYEDIKNVYEDAKKGDFGAFVKWTEYNLAQAAGFIGVQAVATIAGGLVGSAVGPEGTLGGAVTGAVAPGLVRSAIVRLAAARVAQKAEQLGLKAAADQVSRDAIEAAAVKAVTADTIAAGQVAGGIAFNVPTMVGATYGAARDQKDGGELDGEDLLRVGVGGTVAGLIGTIATKFGLHGLQEGGLQSLATKGLATRVAGGAAVYGAGGAAEMTGMTAAQRFGAGQALTGDEANNSYLNAAASGTLMGAVPGGVAGARSRFRSPQPLGDGSRTVDPITTIMDPNKDIDEATQASLELTRATTDSLGTNDERLAMAAAERPLPPPSADDAGMRLAKAGDSLPTVDPQALTPAANDIITSQYLKNIDERGGVALQHEADHLEQAGAGRPFDSVLPAEPLAEPAGARPNGAAPADLVEQLQSVNTPAAGRLLADLRAGRITPAEARPAADQMTQEGVQKDPAFSRREQTPELDANQRLAAAAEAPPPDTTVADRLATAAREAAPAGTPEPVAPGSPIIKASPPRAGEVMPLPTGEDGTERKVTMVDAAQLPKAAPGAKPGALNQTSARMITDLGRRFGKHVQFYSGDQGAPGGFVHSDHPDTIFINKDAKEAHLAIFGHELFHMLKRESPKSAQAFMDAVSAQMTPEAAEKFKKNYGNLEGGEQLPGGLGAGHMEEVSADLMGSAMLKPEFWTNVFDKLGTDGPKGAARLAAIVQRTVRAVMGAFGGKGFEAEHYVNDFKSIHDAAAKALQSYALDRQIPAREMEIHRLKAAQETARVPLAKRAKSEPMGQKGEGSTKQSPPRSHFEVAPDPSDTKSKAEWDAMDYHEKQRVSLNVVEKLVPKVLAGMGVKGELVPQVGGWREDNNPSFMLHIDDEAKLPIVAEQLGRILKQEAVGMVADHPFEGSAPMTEFKITLPKNMGYEDIARVYEQLRGIKEGGESIIQGHSTSLDGNDMRVLHDPAGSGISSADLQQRIRAHMGSEYGVEARQAHARFIETAGEQHESGNGEQERGATDLLRHEATRLAAAEIERARQSSKTARPENAEPVRHTVEAQDENAAPATVQGRSVAPVEKPASADANGRGSAKGDTLVGTHYSHKPRESLSGDYYGTGIRGAERHRLMSATDNRIRSRTDFYINKGKGVVPEMGLGRHAHEATLDRMYNGSDNPEGIPSKDMNAFESEVLNRGYKGYYVRDNLSGQGRAVVLGEHARNIPVEHVGEGPRPARQDLPEVKQSTSRKEPQTEKSYWEAQALGHERKAETMRAKYERTGESRWLRHAETNEKSAAGIRAQIASGRYDLKESRSRQDNLDEYMKGARYPDATLYHGTARDISAFRPKQANAVFLTPHSEFAHDFAHMSMEYMQSHAADELGEKRAQEIFEQARKQVEAKQAEYNDGLEPDFEQQKLEIRQAYGDLLREAMPTGQNIMPVRTRVQKPFDYEDPKQVEALATKVFDDMPASPAGIKRLGVKGYQPMSKAEFIEAVEKGSWVAIETPKVQEAIKALGHDAFHVKEGGVKNLGVYNPADIKSAIGNRGTFDKTNPDITMSPKRPSDMDPARLAKYASIEKHLTPQERGELTKKTAENLVDLVGQWPTAPEHLAAAAYAGRAARGWYEKTTRALGNVFGVDAPRFAALLAATSPQTDVNRNFGIATRLWSAWVKAGRPTDRDTIVKMGEAAARGADAGWLHDSYTNNAVIALTHEDPVGHMLSGPKVDSFMRNLLGHVDEVTNDTWMAHFHGINATLFKSKNIAENGRDRGAKNAGYLAASALTRRAADILSERTGETWTPAEVQETVWSWAKTLAELGDKKGNTDRSLVDLLNDPEFTHDLITATPDFRTQFHTEGNERALRDAGYGPKLDELGAPGDNGAAAPAAESGAAGKTRPFDSDTQERLDRESAERLQRTRTPDRVTDDQKVYLESKTRDYNFGKDLTPDQEAALRAVGLIKDKETVKQQFAKASANWKLKAVQGILDQYRAVKDVSPVAYKMMRMANSSEGSIEAQLLFGKLKLDQGEYVPSVDTKDPTGGFAAVMGALQGEHPRFLAWVAAQRAESLKAQGRENLFTDTDISRLKGLDQGQLPDGSDRGPAYATALKNLTEYNKAVLDIGLKRGMISQELYDSMVAQPFVPFYRAMVDKSGAPVPASGMTSQYFSKQLKGGEEQLKDNLLGNVIQNWSHILTASAKNSAALRAIDDMQAANLAHLSEPGDGAVRVVRDGQDEHYQIHDPYVAEAMGALNYVAPAYLKPFGAMKRVLTYGITANPVFKLRTLLRETAAATAQSEISKNFASNLVQGWQNTRAGSDIFAQTLASGGQIRFGSMERGPRLDKLIQRAGGTPIDETHIEKWGRMISDAAEFYHEVGNRVENVNRTALYEQLRAKGYSHSDASFAAKDLLDFTASGRWPVVKFLTSSVPFMNARLQSAYAMVRAGTLHPAQVGAVVGAVALGSLGLMLYEQQNDKQWWDSRTDYDRDAYWAFKMGDHALYIPKPFELGAMGTMAERLWELGVDHSITTSQFGHNFGQTILNTFAMDPTPQIVKPLAAVWANKDPGTQRPIESTSDQQLRPEDRYDENTSYVARVLGSIGLPNPASLVEAHWDQLSPKQVDYLLKGYFGSLATLTTAGIDAMIHPLTGEGASPAWKSDTYSLGFYKEAPSDQSAFTEALYNRATQVHEAFASLRRARELGDTAKVREIMTEEKDSLRQKPMIDAAEKQISAVNKMILQVKASTSMDADAKRAMLTRLNSQKNSIAERVHAGTVSMSG